MGISDEEVREAVQVAASVGASRMLSLYDRARVAVEAGYQYWKPPQRGGHTH